MTAAPLPFRVFVYGTLRRGGRFHDRYCRGALAIEGGAVRGRRSNLPAGYPVIDVPPRDVLSHGSADPLADARRLATLAPRAIAFDAQWPEVRGEILTFDDPAARLPALDELEGFAAGAPSLYRRVALPVRLDGGGLTVAWTYVRGD